MSNPWDVRPFAGKGDDAAEPIWTQVGRALTWWETAESAAANLFDAMVASQPSNAAAYFAFVTVKTGSARSELLQAAFKRAMMPDDPAYFDTTTVINALSEFSARRNEIAHGRVYNLGEHGYCLGPNNIMRNKWKNGAAKYQYSSSDVGHYADCFENLAGDLRALADALVSRNIADSKTSKARRGA